MDGVGASIHGKPLKDAGQTEAVISVKVSNANMVNRRSRNSGHRELALGSLSGIKQKALAIPTQQIRIVVPFPGGNLAGCSKSYQFPAVHTEFLYRAIKIHPAGLCHYQKWLSRRLLLKKMRHFYNCIS
jgi:hypothetical protein